MPQSDDPKIDRFYMAVGERVRAARAAARMTQATLAARLGLTRSSVANLEAGRQRIPLHVFAMVADILDVDPGKLLPDGLMAAKVPELSDLDEQLAVVEDSSRDFVESALAQLIDTPDAKE
ncbi:helix-turn-helix domain-containing protein [Streptomyces sp. NBC_00285]|uniref:helix-turn-helix domain-containing protein n=1 Tax=Streptomyces sp. NBC_00285 TaxID=2975700 RepID=UPI002E27D41E|nr:helix-turn-helix transcriptional regulator [Streptomyces sp. NBC_00285]